jgi:hypothetical protein
MVEVTYIGMPGSGESGAVALQVKHGSTSDCQVQPGIARPVCWQLPRGRHLTGWQLVPAQKNNNQMYIIELQSMACLEVSKAEQ